MNLKITFLFIVVLTLLLVGCGKNYEYWDLSKFKIDTNALKDGDEIKLLYTSQGPDYNQNQEYYIHVVVVNLKTGDTVNILTTDNNGFDARSADKVYNYYDMNNIASVASRLWSSDSTTLKEIRNVSEIKNIKLKQIDKVARDPEFDHIADNKFPTVIGSIGQTSNENQ